MVALYIILKHICKKGAMIMFFPNWILITYCFRLDSPIIVLTAIYLIIPNYISKYYILVPKEYRVQYLTIAVSFTFSDSITL